MQGVGAQQHAHIDPRARGRAADAEIAAAAARHLGRAAQRLAQSLVQFDLVAVVAPGGQQHAGNDRVVLRPVHVHLRQRNNLLEELQRVFLVRRQQIRQEKGRGARFVAGVADEMPVLAGAVGLKLAAADRAAQPPRLAPVDQGLPTEHTVGKFRRFPAAAGGLFLFDFDHVVTTFRFPRISGRSSGPAGRISISASSGGSSPSPLVRISRCSRPSRNSAR